MCQNIFELGGFRPKAEVAPGFVGYDGLMLFTLIGGTVMFSYGFSFVFWRRVIKKFSKSEKSFGLVFYCCLTSLGMSVFLVGGTKLFIYGMSLFTKLESSILLKYLLVGSLDMFRYARFLVPAYPGLLGSDFGPRRLLPWLFSEPLPLWWVTKLARAFSLSSMLFSLKANCMLVTFMLISLCCHIGAFWNEFVLEI